MRHATLASSSRKTLSVFLNVYINDLFYEVYRTNIYNFADDTTPHASCFELNKVIIDLDSNVILEWFRDNYMTLNEDKCHLLVYMK